MNEKPLIVVVNDDGVYAKGFNTLVAIATKYGDVVAVAPDTERSGSGHCVTVINPLKTKPIKEQKGLLVHACNGSPVDCVKLAIKVFADRKPDIVFSGINHGSNVGTNIFYSGTMGAAIESVFEGVPAIGFSLCSYHADADFDECYPFVENIISGVLKCENIKNDLCLNVNIPYHPQGGIKGIKVCSMSKGVWVEDYVKRNMPSSEKPYYWISGKFSDENPSKDSETTAIDNGYVSVLPVSIDVTRYESKQQIADMLNAGVL